MSVETRECESCGEEIELRSFPTPWGQKILGGRHCEDCLERMEAEAEAEKQRQRRELRIDRSGIPPVFQGLPFAEMDQAPKDRKAAIAAAGRWARAEKPGGLLLHGPVGAGKSRLASIAAWEYVAERPIRFVSVPVLLAHLLAAFDDEERAMAVRIITGHVALVLDDLDKTKPSEWARAQLFAAIDERVNHEAPLLVTTNLSPGRIAQKLGDPIASRLAGYCEVVEMGGRDRRLDL